MWYVPEGEPRTDPREALERVLLEDWTATVQGLDLGDDPEADPRYAELVRKFHDAGTLERAMIEGYVQWLQETGADSEYDVVGSEQVLTAELEVTDIELSHAVRAEPDHRWSRPITVLSLQDVRLRRKTDGVRLFIDHKTVGDLRRAVPTLPMDPQMLHYHLLEFLTTEDADRRCDGALYNMLRKVKRTKAANPPFFDRVEVRHNPHEIDAYRRGLLNSAREILRAEDALRTGADPLDVVPARPRESCSYSCDFFGICNMFNDGSRAEDAVAGLYTHRDNYERYGIVRENA
jgi:hypothetical protein